MGLNDVLGVLFYTLVRFFCLSTNTAAMEYCLAESFLAHCSESEVIVMETAQFGRMELGRCVTRNYGYLGCSANVLSQLDAVCSGLRSCEMSVSEPSLVRTKPCPLDFSSYLEATYRCVTVETMPPKGTCHENRYHVIRNVRGFISGSIPDSSIADDPCVLVFNLPNGQRLTLTLIDFGYRDPHATELAVRDLPSRDHPSGDHPVSDLSTKEFESSGTRDLTRGIPPTRDHPPSDRPSSYLTSVSSVQRSVCRQYAVVREPATGLSVPICAGGAGQARARHVYLSRSSLVHLQLTTWSQVASTATETLNAPAPQPAKYLLQYEVVGCPANFIVPEGAQARYEIDRLIIWCNQSKQSTVLVCTNGVWTGEPRNCTAATQPDSKLLSEDGFPKDLITLPPLGLSVLIIVGVALVVVVYISITVVFAMYFRRRRKRQKRAEISTAVSAKLPVTADRFGDQSDHPPLGRLDHPPPGRLEELAVLKAFPGEECIPMLETPHLILDTTSGRTSGHVCPACLEIKSQSVEPIYVRGASRGGAGVGREGLETMRPTPTRGRMGPLDPEVIDRTVGRTRAVFNIPHVPIRT